MDITIIGTGNMARGIATRALAGGHTVTLLGTDSDKAQALAGELSGDVRTGTVGDPLSGDVVVLAVWYQALDDVLGRYGDQLTGKIVIDITNPVDPQTYAPLTVAAGSAAQEIAAKAPGAKVVKAFNTTFAGSLVEGQVADQPLDVFIASDDDEAKAVVRELAESAGLRVLDAARSPSPVSSKAPATCTWRSSPASAARTPAPCGSSPSVPQRLGAQCSGARPRSRPRYADGASPNWRLNAREKYSWSPYPAR